MEADKIASLETLMEDQELSVRVVKGLREF